MNLRPYLLQSFDNVRINFRDQIVESVRLLHVASHAIFVVRTEAVIATSLDVQRGQIEA